MTNFQKVKTFMQTFGQDIKSKPSFSTEKINQLRYNLINEELEELKQAIEKKRFIRSCRCINRYIIRNLWSRACIWNRFRQLF